MGADQGPAPAAAAATVEAWHEIGAAGEPAFVNSWSNYHATYQSAAFRKHLGQVYLKGTIKGGTNLTVAFTLPAGYRPPLACSFPSTPGGNGAGGTVDISAAGVVTIVLGTGTNLQTQLDGISFWIS